MSHTLIHYFGQKVGGVYANEEWCVDGKVHVRLRVAWLMFGGGWRTIAWQKIGPCDNEKCKHYTTSNGTEIRCEKVEPQIVSDADLPPEFVESLQ